MKREEKWRKGEREVRSEVRNGKKKRRREVRNEEKKEKEFVYFILFV